MAPARKLARLALALPVPLARVSASPRALIALRGEIGHRDLAGLAVQVASLVSGGRAVLTLDLRRVTHCDYRSLPALARLAEGLRAHGGALRIVGANTYLATILRFGGLEGLLVTQPDAARAAAAGAETQASLGDPFSGEAS